MQRIKQCAILLLMCSLFVVEMPVDAQRSLRDYNPVQRYWIVAFDFIAENTLYKDRIANWDGIFEAGLAQLNDETSDDVTVVYPMIDSLLERLNDKHSHFLPPAQASLFFDTTPEKFGLRRDQRNVVTFVYPGSAAEYTGIEVGDTIITLKKTENTSTVQYRDADTFQIHTKVMHKQPFDPVPQVDSIYQHIGDGIGYIESPGILSQAVVDDYVSVMHRAIQSAGAKREICGWIVDLRRNEGGQIAPILLGLGPILGERDLFQFQYISPIGGKTETWHYQNNGIYLATRLYQVASASTLPDKNYSDIPTAVLIGPRTGSAGELALISLRGRDDTRTFGESTYGIPTMTSWIRLTDGAILMVASGISLDMNGTLYEGSIQPDEVVESNWATFGSEDDAVIQAARAWLDTTYDCQ